MSKKKRWVRLKRMLRKKVNIPRGDGGAHSDKGIIITKPYTDSTHIVRDTVVVGGPIKQ